MTTLVYLAYYQIQTNELGVSKTRDFWFKMVIFTCKTYTFRDKNGAERRQANEKM